MDEELHAISSFVFLLSRCNFSSVIARPDLIMSAFLPFFCSFLFPFLFLLFVCLRSFYSFSFSLNLSAIIPFPPSLPLLTVSGLTSIIVTFSLPVSDGGATLTHFVLVYTNDDDATLPNTTVVVGMTRYDRSVSFILLFIRFVSLLLVPLRLCVSLVFRLHFRFSSNFLLFLCFVRFSLCFALLSVV